MMLFRCGDSLTEALIFLYLSGCVCLQLVNSGEVSFLLKKKNKKNVTALMTSIKSVGHQTLIFLLKVEMGYKDNYNEVAEEVRYPY